ncbi:MAG TPA: septum formation initiator family protein [Anaerovoracaceae bacterium]|nr:septum formation initiator family protein [Anaerovoracaceae bacterium]
MLKKKKRRSREFKNNIQVIDIEEARQVRKQKREEAAEKKYKVRKKKSVITERQAGKKARRRMVYFFIFLFIIGIITVSAFNIVSLKLTEARTVKEQQALMEQKTRLEKIYSQVNSPDYIEQQARQQLKMIRPGEILYVLPDKNKETTNGGIVPK